MERSCGYVTEKGRRSGAYCSVAVLQSGCHVQYIRPASMRMSLAREISPAWPWKQLSGPSATTPRVDFHH